MVGEGSETQQKKETQRRSQEKEIHIKQGIEVYSGDVHTYGLFTDADQEQ